MTVQELIGVVHERGELVAVFNERRYAEAFMMALYAEQMRTAGCLLTDFSTVPLAYDRIPALWPAAAVAVAVIRWNECPICGETADPATAKAADRSRAFGPGEFAAFECGHCKSVFVSNAPMPEPSDEGFGGVAHGGDQPTGDTLRLYGGLRNGVRRRLDLVLSAEAPVGGERSAFSREHGVTVWTWVDLYEHPDPTAVLRGNVFRHATMAAAREKLRQMIGESLAQGWRWTPSAADVSIAERAAARELR